MESAGISFPGAKEVLGTSKDIFEIHNKAVAAGSMGQILLWVGFFEMVAGWPAMMQAPPPPGRGPRAAPQRATLGLARSARSLSLCADARGRPHAGRLRLRPARPCACPQRPGPDLGVRCALPHAALGS